MKRKFYTKLTMVLAAIFMFTYASAQTTVSVQITDPLDDAEEYASDVGGEVVGAVYNTSSDLELVFDSEVQYVGMIFRDLQVPAGATIDNAYIQFQVDAISPGTTDAALTLEIYGNKEANVTVGFDEAVPFGISSRTPTEAKVAWAPGASVNEGDKGENERTDDISTIISEIVGLDGWASGNALMVIIKWTGDVNQTDNINREMEACDGDPTGAPTLVVTYSEGGGGGGGGEPVTVEYQISESGDDVEEYASDIGGEVVGNMDITSSDLELVFDSETQFVGMIFRSVAVPVGATITNAYVQFQVDAVVPGVTDAAITLSVYGAKEATVAAPWVDGATFGVSSHPATDTKVSWTPGASVNEGDKGVNEQTPDISAVIQEIIGVDGWASGNNMMVVVTGDPLQSENINREVESFDGDPTGAPKLVITYTEGGGGTGVAKFNAEFSSLIYPNPSEGRLYINNPSSDKFDYEIYTINGRMVRSQQNNTGSNVEVDLSDFVKGMYFVNVRTTDRSETHKLILK